MRSERINNLKTEAPGQRNLVVPKAVVQYTLKCQYGEISSASKTNALRIMLKARLKSLGQIS